MRILFLNQSPNRTAYDTTAISKLLNSYASPGTTVEIGFPDDYPGSKAVESILSQGAMNGLHHMMEVPSLVQKIVWAEQNGYDAVIQSNTFDPGVDAGRLAVKIPVIGLFRTAMHFGLTLADRIGITVPVATHVPYTWRILRANGLDGFVSDVRPLPEGAYGGEKDAIFGGTVGVIRALVEETDAQIVLPLGGALIPYVVDPLEIEREVGVQVLNTKSIGIRTAETCVSLGFTQSPRCYPVAKVSAEDFTSNSA